MRWFKLATITPIACLLITAAIPNFPLNNRAVAQERFQFNLAQANTSIEGNWEWVCCEAKYWGNLEISQNGNTITGIFRDTNNGTSGNIKGKIKGNRVEFIRTWYNGRQYFTLFLSDNGQVLEGVLKGNRDESVGVEFKATRQ